MNKIHPNAASAHYPSPPTAPASTFGGGTAAVLTVWRKSLLLNCSGFTVFDTKGTLVFRVDSYASAPRAEVLLMDAAGQPLLTLRRKKLSLGEKWLVYDGEGAPGAQPRLAVRRHLSPIHCGALAHVTVCGAEEGFLVGGSCTRRSCEVVGEQGRKLAEIRRKEAVAGGATFDGDVFRLIVETGFDGAVAMAIVIVLEKMFGGGR